MYKVKAEMGVFWPFSMPQKLPVFGTYFFSIRLGGHEKVYFARYARTCLKCLGLYLTLLDINSAHVHGVYTTLSSTNTVSNKFSLHQIVFKNFG